jgi:dTDP-4-dehydrorhamnose reductase
MKAEARSAVTGSGEDGARARVAVLGASGYFGGAILAELRGRAGVDAVALRSPHDLAVQQPTPTVVVNCIGYYGPDRKRLREANVEFARVAAEQAGRQGARLVHVSSSAVFDAIRTGELTESTSPRPRTAYGTSKLAAERDVTAVSPDACIVRPAKLFGGADPRGRLHTLMRYACAGRPLPAPETPVLWANFVWIRDGARVVADEVLSSTGARMVHVASPVEWQTFLSLLGEAIERLPARMPAFLERSLGLAAVLLDEFPRVASVRRVERLLELWDRRRFVDSSGRLGPESVAAGLRDVAGKLET